MLEPNGSTRYGCHHLCRSKRSSVLHYIIATVWLMLLTAGLGCHCYLRYPDKNLSCLFGSTVLEHGRALESTVVVLTRLSACLQKYASDQQFDYVRRNPRMVRQLLCATMTH